MTPEQKDRVVESWPKLCENAEGFIHGFYKRMFELDPHLERLFEDMDKQVHALAHMIGGAIVSLKHNDEFAETHQALGRRHAAYRVPVDAFDTFREAFASAVALALSLPREDTVPEAWGALFDAARDPFLTGLRTERRRLQRNASKT